MVTVLGLPIPDGDPAPAYIMRTTRGTAYVLAESGAVLARSNGPRGWRYSGRWIILGAATRFNAHAWATLPAILADGVPGHGYIMDRDHGTLRRWGSERMASLRRLEPGEVRQ